MSNFSNREKMIAGVLSKTPLIKSLLKRIYQLVNLIFYKKTYLFKTNYLVEEVDNTLDSSFFGYYDKCPENLNGDKLIFYRTDFNTKKLPSSKNSIKIVLKCLKTNSTRFIDKTFSYNWQQGSKMMWLNNKEFIYNVFSKESNSYRSKIYNVNKKSFKEISLPIYDCYKDDYALSISYVRLMELRPDYGYKNINFNKKEFNYKSDGIFKVSLINNTSQLIISIDRLIKLKYLESMRYAKHKVNHVMISPDGENFMFLHRWHCDSGEKFDRLLISDKFGKHIKIVSDEGWISHCCWKNNNSIIGYLKYDKKINFYEINILNGHVKLISDKLKKFGDGHPSYKFDNFIFDSYPDRSRMKKLFIYNYKNDQILKLGEFYEPLGYFDQSRCDLHPRFSRSASSIYFDSVHHGKRKLYKLNLNN